MKYRLLALALLCYPVCSSAQYNTGMVLEDAVWKAPTPQTALDLIMVDQDLGREAAIAVLRQTITKRSVAELDAFADELGRIFREGTRSQASRAALVLELSAKADYPEGIPYTRAKDVFIQAYESLVNENFDRARSALYGLMQTGGEDYVRHVFDSSELPPKPCWDPGQALLEGTPRPPKEEWCPYKKSVWCAAGNWLLLFGNKKPDPGQVLPVCFSAAKIDGRWVILS